MKNILFIIVFLLPMALAAQSTPAQPDQKAVHFADSLFSGSGFQFEITEFDFPPEIRDILLKFNNAVAVNKEWFTAYSRQGMPGQPLPYNEKFGISPEEYRKIKNMDQVHPALKVVDTQAVTILRQDGKLSFKGEGDGSVLNYLEIHLDKNTVVFAGDTIPLIRGINPNTAAVYGISRGYTWRLEKTDLRNGLQADRLTARMVEIDLGVHFPDNKPVLRIQYQDMENGVSRANLDLSGYLRSL